MKKSQYGFTLIELLISMTLTVVIGAVSYRFLDAAIAASEHGDQVLDQINQVERFWALLQSDLEHIIDRPVPIPATGADTLSVMSTDAGRRPALLTANSFGLRLADLTARDGALFWFVRAGWSNPLQQPRSDLQRVLYRIDENGDLQREYAPERNQDLNAASVGALTVLTGIEQIQVRFLRAGTAPIDSNWLYEWESLSVESLSVEAESLPHGLPVAVEVSVQTAAMGLLRRTLLLPGI